jgi:membrane protease YdiL (CAAX protease family)
VLPSPPTPSSPTSGPSYPSSGLPSPPLGTSEQVLQTASYGVAPVIGGPATSPGWYPDPWQWWGYRWWSGTEWSGFTYEPPIVEAPLPPEPIPTFPVHTAAVGVAILFVSLLVEKFVFPAALEWLPVGFYVALGVAVVYLPVFFWCIHVSRRFGSGKVLHDLGLKVKGADVGWGVLTWLGILMGNIVLLIVIKLTGIPFTSNVGGGKGLAGRDRSLFLMFAITAVVAAPFFEELLFRGLVMRALRSKFPTVAAVVMQGIMFGVAHADPRFGAGNLGLLMVLSWAGIGLGFVAHKLRRNGGSMVAHAIMNGIVMLTLLASGAGG